MTWPLANSASARPARLTWPDKTPAAPKPAAEATSRVALAIEEPLMSIVPKFARLAARTVDAAESVPSPGPISISPSFVNVPPIVSDEPPFPLDTSNKSLLELITPPTTVLAPASMKVKLGE